MPSNFWEENDFVPYEQGGITGGNSGLDWRTDPNVIATNGGGYAGGLAGPNDSGSSGDTAAAPANAFDPYAQVGHDGTINGMTREQWRDAWQGSGVTDIKGMQNWMAQHGGQVLSDNGTVKTPFGETMDLLQGAKTGHGTAAWGGVGGGPAPQNNNMAGDVVGQSIGGYAMLSGSGSGVGQSGHLSGSFAPYTYENFTAPEPFKAPTMEDAQNDPGYAFGLQEGNRNLTNMAAKNGMLRSGMALKDFAKYANDYASTKYGDVYNRAMQGYQTNFGNALNVNQANNGGRLAGFTANTNADLGYGNLNLGYTRAGNDYSLGQGQLALGNKTADQNYSLGQGNLGLGYYNAGNNYALGTGRLALDTQGQQFNQGYSLADLGLRAAGQAGGYGSQYGANAGNYATGAGNAQAAGQVGSSNAWTSGMTNAGNAALNAYGMYRYGGGGSPTPYSQGGYSGSGFNIPG